MHKFADYRLLNSLGLSLWLQLYKYYLVYRLPIWYGYAQSMLVVMIVLSVLGLLWIGFLFATNSLFDVDWLEFLSIFTPCLVAYFAGRFLWTEIKASEEQHKQIEMLEEAMISIDTYPGGYQSLEAKQMEKLLSYIKNHAHLPPLCWLAVNNKQPCNPCAMLLLLWTSYGSMIVTLFYSQLSGQKRFQSH